MKPKSFVVLSMILILVSVNSSIYSQGTGLLGVKHAEQIITVGGPNADVAGFTSEAIQIAIDAIRTRGGGIVNLNTGVGIFLCWRVQNGIFRNETQHCPITDSFYSSALPALANISYHLGRSLRYNDTTNKFTNDAEADAMLTREYRKPYGSLMWSEKFIYKTNTNR